MKILKIMIDFYRIEQLVSKDVVPNSGHLQVREVERVCVDGVDEVVLEDELHGVGDVDVSRSEVAERVSGHSDRSFVVVLARVVVGPLQVLHGQGKDVEGVAVGDDVDAAEA